MTLLLHFMLPLASRITRLIRFRSVRALSVYFLAALLPALLAATVWHQPAYAQEDEGTVVVQLDEEDVIVRSIDVNMSPSGVEALELAGFELITTSNEFGTSICSIAGTGCPASDCFCDEGAWTYQFWDGSSWQTHATGPDGVTVAGGDIEGWRWAPDFGAAPKPAPPLLAALDALDWLATQQSAEDGSYGGAANTVETLLALDANQIDPATWQRGPDSPPLSSVLHGVAASYAADSPAAAGKLGVAMAPTDICRPTNALAPSDYYSTTLGSYAEGSGPTAWSILGTVALSETVEANAVDHLRGQAQADGGWEWFPGWDSDSNSTALAIQALIAAGESISSTTVQEGLNYLESLQNSDGGFPYAAGDNGGNPSDANSTSYAIQALVAAGEDPAAARWTEAGGTPIEFLLGIQSDDGSLAWQPGLEANLLATQQAIPALLGEANPYASGTPLACRALHLPLVDRVAPDADEE